MTRRLQDTARQHAAEQSRLSQELSTRQQSLEQTRLELVWARAELQRAWREGNSSRLELGSRDAELGRARQELAVLEKEMQEVQGKLNNSESTVAILRSCTAIGRAMVEQGWGPPGHWHPSATAMPRHEHWLFLDKLWGQGGPMVEAMPRAEADPVMSGAKMWGCSLSPKGSCCYGCAST